MRVNNNILFVVDRNLKLCCPGQFLLKTILAVLVVACVSACDFRGTKGLGKYLRSTQDTTLQKIVISCKSWASEERIWTENLEEVCREFETVSIPRHYFSFISHKDIKSDADWPDVVRKYRLELLCTPHCASKRAPAEERRTAVDGWLISEDLYPSYGREFVEAAFSNDRVGRASYYREIPIGYSEILDRSVLPGYLQAADPTNNQRSYFIATNDENPIHGIKCKFYNSIYACDYYLSVKSKETRCEYDAHICGYGFIISAGNFQHYDDVREYKQLVWNVVFDLCRYMECDLEDFRERLSAL